jgi:hypothetical protein
MKAKSYLVINVVNHCGCSSSLVVTVKGKNGRNRVIHTFNLPETDDFASVPILGRLEARIDPGMTRVNHFKVYQSSIWKGVIYTETIVEDNDSPM